MSFRPILKPILTAVSIVILPVLYLNIERYAEKKGWDLLLVGLGDKMPNFISSMSENGWLIVLGWLLIAGTVFIWLYPKREKESKSRLGILFAQGKEPFLEILPEKTPAEAIYEKKDFSKRYIGRFIIRNLSKTEPVKSIKVDLLEVIPSQKWITGLPLPLRFKDDKQARQEIDLNIDSEIAVEIFNYSYNAGNDINTRLVLLHSLNDRLIEAWRDIDPMQFKLRISSANGGASIVKNFKFDPTKNEEDIWVMLND